MKHPGRVAALFLVGAFAARAEDAKPHAEPVKSTANAATATTSSNSNSATVTVSSGAHHHWGHVDSGIFIADMFLNMLQFGMEAALLDEAASTAPAPLDDSWGRRIDRRDDPPPLQLTRVRPHEARQGLLFSFGVGGGSLRYSRSGYGPHTGAFDLNFRLGYGFNDRFQFFGDFDLADGTLSDGTDITSWTATMRGQTVLIGDRDGNGLNVNAGIGLGGISESYGWEPSANSPAGLALAAGLSYDARIGRHFALSPELFYVWHQVPNRDVTDVASTLGLRLNLLWYLY